MIITNKLTLSIPCRETSIEECKALDVFTKLDFELKQTPGLGLAANQIGLNVRAFTLRVSLGKSWPDIINMINPILSDFLLPIVYQNEGCLSFPGVQINTARFEQVTCSWLDFDSGEQITVSIYGVPAAVVVQHEVDHLDGKTIWDRQVQVKKAGRNDSCPECLKSGVKIKYKKCKEHFKG